jgi:Protein of unknown function (DUF2846)
MTKHMVFRLLFLLLALSLATGAVALQDDKSKKEKDDDDGMNDAVRAELEKKGCPAVSTKHKATTDKKTHPTPEPSADKALVYVVRPTGWGGKVQTKLAVNGKWVGVNRGYNYFFFTLDPGEYAFCSVAENKSVMALKVEAGKTYYLQQKLTAGFMKARNKLVALDEAKGKEALAKTHPSDYEPKEPATAAKN